MLTLKNIDVHYGKIHAVRRASLHVRQGEIVALIGGNGAGKTTLLSTISGLIKPTSGEIVFNEKKIHTIKPNTIVKRGISQVPEGRLVFKPMSVTDNLLLGSYHRYSVRNKKDVLDDLDTVFSIFPVLKERSRQPAGTLSGGEQQMLAIGRSLMAKPRVLLLDEPSMGLAPNIIKDIFKHILSLNKELGLTVLLVEQNAKSALKIADRGYVLETGRIVLQGPAQELLSNRDVQRAYLGRDLDTDNEDMLQT